MVMELKEFPQRTAFHEITFACFSLLKLICYFQLRILEIRSFFALFTGRNGWVGMYITISQNSS